METKYLVSAVHSGSATDILEYLTSGGDPNESFDGWLPLNIAVDQKDPEKVAVLLKFGVNPNRRDKFGKNALYCAVGIGEHAILEQLISAGGRANEKFDCGNLIHVAVLWREGHVVINQLCKLGVDPNEFNMDGMTPLILAAANDAAEAIPILVSCGANINLPDSRQGWTPLMHSTIAPRQSTESVLRSLGADTSAVDFEGRTVEQIRQRKT